VSSLVEHGALALLATALLAAPASARARAVRSPVALTTAPARVVLIGTARAVVRVTNSGAQPVAVDVSRAGFALSLRGRPRIVRTRAGRSAASWLKLEPAHFALPARTSVSLLVAAALPPNAQPGDHDALVLLTTRPRAGARLAVRVRLGVRVIIRAPGAIRRRLELRGLSVLRRGPTRALELDVVNRGNMTESLAGVRAAVFSTRTGRRVAMLVAPRRELRPRTRGIVEFRLRRHVRGAAAAQVTVPAASGRSAVRRTYRITL
jgi:hypothetical protein